MKSSLTLQFSSGLLLPIENKTKARMHSSRMRTVSCNGCLGGAWGCVCVPRGLSGQGGFLAWGVYPLGPRGKHSPLWTEFLTHACENITFSQLLLPTVINSSLSL